MYFTWNAPTTENLTFDVRLTKCYKTNAICPITRYCSVAIWAFWKADFKMFYEIIISVGLIRFKSKVIFPVLRTGKFD